MTENNGSDDSFDEFFGTAKTDNDDDKTKENDIPTSSGVAALIKAQPVVHRRRTPSETQPNTNSKKAPLTTNVKNASTASPMKAKPIDSPQSKVYDTDFDDDTSTDGKKKHSSLPAPKQRPPEKTRHDSDSKIKPSYNNTRRKEHFLPYIRPKKRPKALTKRFPKETKSEIEQRVLSAQHDQFNKLQSRVAEARRQLAAERMENKTLRLIQKREVKALKKYEDQEYDVLKIAGSYTHEIEYVQEKISDERDLKSKLEKELEDRDEVLRNQTKRMKIYEKLVNEKDLDESDELRERLKETDKELKKFEEKITKQEKQIENLEKNHRYEIKQELIKQRDLKREIEDNSKKYTDLRLKFEDKTRQVDTMHIYIQRGGRRPSISPVTLSKSRSLQSLQDTSPRFREKIIEYDKKRREQQKQEEKLNPKPKPLPLPNNPPPKRERKKYVPNTIRKPQTTKTLSMPAHVIHDEKPPIIENEILEHLPTRGKPPVRRLSTPNSIAEDKSEIDDEIIIEPTRQKLPSLSLTSITTRTIQRSEQHLSQAPIHKRPLTPVSPPAEPKFNSLGPSKDTTTSSLFKHTESPPPTKPHVTRELNDKWSDFFDTDNKQESTKEDLLSKLISDEQQERQFTTTTRPSPPSSKRPSMIMFEPTSLSTNGHQTKPPARIATSNVYDFDQAVINLHEGKPVTAQPTTKTSVDSFESLFGNKPANQINGRDDTFTTTRDEPDSFESLFGQSLSAVSASTALKPNSRQYPSQNDKLQRPKVVTNAPRSIPNRTVVEEIEEFVL